MKIIEVDHSIANRFNGYIEINKNLKKYPELYNPILAHELAHSNEPFSIHDLKLDLVSDSEVSHIKLLKFMFKYPKSFLQLSPIIYNKKKGFSIDINLIIMYLVMFITFFVVIVLGVKYL